MKICKSCKKYKKRVHFNGKYAKICDICELQQYSYMKGEQRINYLKMSLANSDNSVLDKYTKCEVIK